MSDGFLLACGRCTVAIDYWTAPHASAFFLTHMHADHYKGLHDDWNQGRIYCSEVTGALLQRKWPSLSCKIVPLDESICIKLHQQERLTVTAIDANHCPGAVMFLFEGSCGRVLHTGDFRWEHEAQTELLQHPALQAGPLDLLVLDNTYCHLRYSFPCRLVACQSLISMILAHADMDIVLAIDSLGKEDMLAAVAHATGVQIGVPVERLETISIAGLPQELFTADMSATHIRALPKWMVTLELVAKLNRSKPTLAIVPTGFACLDSMTSKVAKAANSTPVTAFPSDGGTGHQQLQSQGLLPIACDQQLDSSAGQQIDASQSQLFQESNLLEDDVKSYAALVHQQKAPDRAKAVNAAELESALPLLKKIPYSLHSSFSELESFVAHLKPQAIVPIVKKCYDPRCPIDPNIHFKHLLGRPTQQQPQQLRQQLKQQQAQQPWQQLRQQLRQHPRQQPRLQSTQQPTQQPRQKLGLMAGLMMKRKAVSAGRCSEQTGEAQAAEHESHGTWQDTWRSCSDAIKHRRCPDKPSLSNACSISACQQTISSVGQQIPPSASLSMQLPSSDSPAEHFATAARGETRHDNIADVCRVSECTPEAAVQYTRRISGSGNMTKGECIRNGAEESIPYTQMIRESHLRAKGEGIEHGAEESVDTCSREPSGPLEAAQQHNALSASCSARTEACDHQPVVPSQHFAAAQQCNGLHASCSAPLDACEHQQGAARHQLAAAQQCKDLPVLGSVHMDTYEHQLGVPRQQLTGQSQPHRRRIPKWGRTAAAASQGRPKPQEIVDAVEDGVTAQPEDPVDVAAAGFHAHQGAHKPQEMVNPAEVNVTTRQRELVHAEAAQSNAYQQFQDQAPASALVGPGSRQHMVSTASSVRLCSSDLMQGSAAVPATRCYEVSVLPRDSRLETGRGHCAAVSSNGLTSLVSQICRHSSTWMTQ